MAQATLTIRLRDIEPFRDVISLLSDATIMAGMSDDCDEIREILGEAFERMQALLGNEDEKDSA